MQENDKDNIPLRRNPIEIFNHAYYMCEILEKEKHPETKVQSLISKTQELFLDCDAIGINVPFHNSLMHNQQQKQPPLQLLLIKKIVFLHSVNLCRWIKTKNTHLC